MRKQYSLNEQFLECLIYQRCLLKQMEYRRVVLVFSTVLWEDLHMNSFALQGYIFSHLLSLLGCIIEMLDRLHA